MSNFADSKTYKVLRTFVKTFAATVLGMVVVYGDAILDITAGEWRGIIAAGVASVALVAYNYLNSNYTDYGIGSE